MKFISKVENLIGPETVNTLPPATYQTFRARGRVAPTLAADVDSAVAQLAELDELGIDFSQITDRLEREGVAAFVKAFDNLLAAIDAKRSRLAVEV